MTESKHPLQEPDALPGRWLALVGVGVVVVTVALGAVAVGIVQHDLDDKLEPPAQGEWPAPLRDAHLETTQLDAPTVVPPHREQAQRARHWGWVDRQAGIVHMPVDVAMQLRLTGAVQPSASQGSQGSQAGEAGHAGHSHQPQPAQPQQAQGSTP